MPHSGSDQAQYMRDYRARNPKVKEYNVKIGRARNRALSELKKLFPREYEILLINEKKKEGLL